MYDIFSISSVCCCYATCITTYKRIATIAIATIFGYSGDVPIISVFGGGIASNISNNKKRDRSPRRDCGSGAVAPQTSVAASTAGHLDNSARRSLWISGGGVSGFTCIHTRSSIGSPGLRSLRRW